MTSGVSYGGVRHARPPRAFVLLAGAAVGFVLGLLAQPALWTSQEHIKQSNTADDYWHGPMHTPGRPRNRLDVKLMIDPVKPTRSPAETVPLTAQLTTMTSADVQPNTQATVTSYMTDVPVLIQHNIVPYNHAQSAAAAVPSAASTGALAGSTAPVEQLAEPVPSVQALARHAGLPGSTPGSSRIATADAMTIPSDGTMTVEPGHQHAASRAAETLEQPLPCNVTYNASSSLPNHSLLAALPLRQLYPRFGTLQIQSSSASFHWVIKSCNRPRLGRLLASTLLSGMLNDLQPASISIVWCKSYQRTKQLPSIIYNLRHSLSLNIWFPSQELDVWPAGATTLTALSVPMLLGAEHLPLLITEDDLVFAPDANMRISTAIQHVEALVRQDPYMMYLYWGEMHGYNHSEPLGDAAFQSVPDDICIGYPQQQSQVLRIVRATLWGTQAQLYSANMTQMMRGLFTDIHAAVAADNESSPFFYLSQVLEDMVVKWGLEQVLGCNTWNSTCHAFVVQPSLVQHCGTVSTLFSNNTLSNPRFHVAKEFPVRLRFPTMADDW